MLLGAGGEKTLVDPLRRLANSVGGNVGRLSTRGTLVDGELRSAQAPSAAPPVWFVFTGEPCPRVDCVDTCTIWYFMHAILHL